jgi:gamma-glutamylaminecyclotransferase
MIRLFIYGTLKRGQRNSHLLRGQTFIGEAETLPCYRLYDAGSYPCLVEDMRNGVAVRGELWEVDPRIVPVLDQLEDAPELYHRATIEVRHTAPPVFAYLYRKDVTGFTDCGDVWPRERGG